MAAWPDRKFFPFAPHYCDVDGGRLHYVDEGNGPPLVIFNTWMWSLLGEASMRRVLAVADPAFRPHLIRRFEELFARVTVIRFPDVGHFVPDEAGPEAAEDIERFLAMPIGSGV